MTLAPVFLSLHRTEQPGPARPRLPGSGVVSTYEDKMAKQSKNSAVAIQNLLDEKREIERWLRRLGMASDKTPEHVKSKVQKDYGRRLEAVLEELQGYRAELDASLRAQRDIRDGLHQQEADAEESLAEAELRHTVGEYDEDKWSTIRTEIQESLERIREDLSVALKEISSLEEVLDAIDTPTGSDVEGPGDAAGADVSDEGELEVVEELEGIPELEEEAAGVTADESTKRGDDQTGAFDEMAFLKSVISGDKSAESLTSSGSRPALEKKDSGERHAAGRKVVSSGERPKVGAEGVGPAERREHGPAKGSTTKTVKCGECGTLNLPTEWYCENCGAELTAL